MTEKLANYLTRDNSKNTCILVSFVSLILKNEKAECVGEDLKTPETSVWVYANYRTGVIVKTDSNFVHLIFQTQDSNRGGFTPPILTSNFPQISNAVPVTGFDITMIVFALALLLGKGLDALQEVSRDATVQKLQMGRKLLEDTKDLVDRYLRDFPGDTEFFELESWDELNEAKLLFSDFLKRFKNSSSNWTKVDILKANSLEVQQDVKKKIR